MHIVKMDSAYVMKVMKATPLLPAISTKKINAKTSPAEPMNIAKTEHVFAMTVTNL